MDKEEKSINELGKIIKNKFHTIYNEFVILLGALSSIVSIITFYKYDIKDIPFLTNDYILIFAIIIFSLLLISFIFYYISNKNFSFYRDKEQGPKNNKNYKNIILENIKNKKLNLLVVGRTNISWFKDIKEDEESDIEKLYINALKNGCKIEFIIQSKEVINNSLDEVTKNTIKKDLPQTIEYFKMLCKNIEKNGVKIQDNFKLSLTTIPVNNSMTIQYHTNNKGDYYNYFSYDIGQNVINVKNAKNPYLLFRNNTVIPEIIYELNNIQKYKTILYEYEEKRDLEKAVNIILNKYHLSSSQRENHNKKIIYHYFERKKLLKENIFYHPVTIQLMITNKCTTECVMCDHHSINSDNELSETEIMHVIDYIQNIETKNIIISGGEPLSRSDCIRILEYAKNKGLNLGLFTNGVKNNNESITIDEAKQIKKYCDWVQLSIDSFEETTYKQIRKNDLSIVKKSLENMEAVGVNLEIVFTIQRLNIDEAINMVKTGKTAFGFRSKVRFKFAHGPDKDNKFLLTNENENKLNDFLKDNVNEENFYSKYFNEMIEKEYFTEADILSGKPLYKKNGKFKENGYICHAINYFCMINSEGDIYPCCFLYDDNNGDNSKIRKKYFHGSLRSNGVIPPLNNVDENKLKEELKKMYKGIDNTKIPVDEEACNYCTRHFYHNALLNELDEKIKEFDKVHKDCNFDNLYPHDEGNTKIWF